MGIKKFSGKIWFKKGVMLRFFSFFTDYTLLYHVIQSRERLRPPFLLFIVL